MNKTYLIHFIDGKNEETAVVLAQNPKIAITKLRKKVPNCVIVDRVSKIINIGSSDIPKSTHNCGKFNEDNYDVVYSPANNNWIIDVLNIDEYISIIVEYCPFC